MFVLGREGALLKPDVGTDGMVSRSFVPRRLVLKNWLKLRSGVIANADGGGIKLYIGGRSNKTISLQFPLSAHSIHHILRCSLAGTSNYLNFSQTCQCLDALTAVVIVTMANFVRLPQAATKGLTLRTILGSMENHRLLCGANTLLVASSSAKQRCGVSCLTVKQAFDSHQVPFGIESYRTYVH